MMHRITEWICTDRVLDQEALHGNDFADYKIAMIHFPEESFPAVVGDFYLTEFLLDGHKPEDVKSFGDFMWLLDRDRLGLAMREALVVNAGIPDEPPHDYSWMETLRRANHPAHVPGSGFRPKGALILAA